MRSTETHTVSFSLTADEAFVRPAAAWVTYRGRNAADGLQIRVNQIKVDLNPGQQFYRIDAEGAAVLVNGETSGYGHEAELTDREKQLFVDEALKVVRANKFAEAQSQS